MPLHVLKAVDIYPKNVSQNEIERVLLKGRSYPSGLDFKVFIKEGARVMLTNNVNISDRLINGQLGTVARIVMNEITQKPTATLYMYMLSLKAKRQVTPLLKNLQISLLQKTKLCQ